MPGRVCGRSELNKALVEVHPTLIGPDHPGDHLHQRAFAGAIFANDSVNGAERAGKINVRECRDAAVPLGNPFQPEEGMTYRVRHQLARLLRF
jgi:hypothetical protein